MDPKFKFSLSGPLKIKKFKKSQKKIEAARILQEIEETKGNIRELNESLDDIYETQEKTLKNQTQGKSLQGYTHMINAKLEDIKKNESYLDVLQKRHERKLKDLNTVTGEVRVLQNLEEKQLYDHKKKINRKQHEDIEDVINGRRNQK